MAAKACTCGGRIWLDGIALVEQVLVVKLLEQPPQAFDILIVVGDIGVLHINPVTHLMGKVCPLGGVHHHVLTATAVVVLDGNLGTDVFLGDAQFLLHAKFHWQTVGIPTSLALHLETLHGLETTEGVLQRACQNVVDTRMAIS